MTSAARWEAAMTPVSNVALERLVHPRRQGRAPHSSTSRAVAGTLPTHEAMRAAVA
jgi:hypothetical protein